METPPSLYAMNFRLISHLIYIMRHSALLVNYIPGFSLKNCLAGDLPAFPGNATLEA